MDSVGNVRGGTTFAQNFNVKHEVWKVKFNQINALTKQARFKRSIKKQIFNFVLVSPIISVAKKLAAFRYQLNRPNHIVKMTYAAEPGCSSPVGQN